MSRTSFFAFSCMHIHMYICVCVLLFWFGAGLPMFGFRACLCVSFN